MTQNKEIRWVRLGDLIEQTDLRNKNSFYTESDIRGISVDKVFTPTKANLEGVAVSSYKVVFPKEFAYVPDTSRRGDKIALAFNDKNDSFMVSSIYTTFKIKDTNCIPEYLYLWFIRSDFNRFARFHSWGSARETLSWKTFLDIKIPVPYKEGEPDVERQQEIVDVWQGVRKLKEENEVLAKVLLELCDAKIVDLYKFYSCKPIGNFIEFVREKNSNCKISLEQGINIQKEFITPQRKNSNLSNRIIVRKGQIAYCSQLNNENVAVAYRYGDDCVVSSVYRVIDLKKAATNIIDKEYLFLHLCRKEFGRFVYWASIGSAYEFLREQNLCEWLIPIPPLEVQQAIVDIYHCARRAKEIANEADKQLKEICPALMQRIIHS